jgi:4-hydroxy-4-methyl-2-oxoglutarate aldolase
MSLAARSRGLAVTVIDGVPICPWDIIVGDSDGVVVVPLDQADSVFEKAKAILGKEDQIRKRMEKGELIFESWD